MNIQEAKQIKIADYLQSLGYSPVKQQGNCLWYKSPFRQETEASFKVNTDRNLWFDYGLGRGGNIVALAGVLYASDHVPYLLGKIAEQAPHIRPISFFYGTHALPISIRVPVIRSNSRLYLVIRFSSNTFSSIPTLSGL